MLGRYIHLHGETYHFVELKTEWRINLDHHLNQECIVQDTRISNLE
jgi:hypothetical protein